MGHGNDGGRSIRIPASCCGLFGLKPTRGRNSVGPLFGDLRFGVAQEHALTRTVLDSAALLDATSGPQPGDPYWAPPKERHFLEEVGRGPGRLKIGTFTQEELEPVTWLSYQTGLKRSGADYLSALEDCQRFSRKTAEWYEKGKYDVLLSSTLTIPPPKIESFQSTQENPTRPLGVTRDLIALTFFCNVTGQPAMSVPLYWNEEGIPVGVQFAGRFGGEAILFRLASQLEKARPWAKRIPSLQG